MASGSFPFDIAKYFEGCDNNASYSNDIDPVSLYIIDDPELYLNDPKNLPGVMLSPSRDMSRQFDRPNTQPDPNSGSDPLFSTDTPQVQPRALPGELPDPWVLPAPEPSIGSNLFSTLNSDTWVGELSDPWALPGSDPVVGSDPDFKVTKSLVGELFDPWDLPGSDPVIGSDLVAAVGVEVPQALVGQLSNARDIPGSEPVIVPDLGGGVTEALVGQLSNPWDLPESDPVVGPNLVDTLDSGVLVPEVGELSDPIDLPGSDFMEVDTTSPIEKNYKRKRSHRARGSWMVGCDQFELPAFRSDPNFGSDTGIDLREAPVGESSHPELIPGPDPVNVEGGSDENVVKLRRRSKKGRNGGKGTAGWLPQDWTVIRRTRMNGASSGVVDKYYVEPITGKRLRSKIEVKRYLETSPSHTTSNTKQNLRPRRWAGRRGKSSMEH